MKESQCSGLGVALVLAAALLMGCVPARTRLAAPDPGDATRTDSRSVNRSGRGTDGSAGHEAATAGRPARMDAEYLRDRALMVPVDGVAPAQVRDNFAAPRGSRRHNAIDIMAPRGTAVLAADDGRVLSMRRNTAGGLIIYVVDADERLIYYYAHLDGYRDGLRQGDLVRKGEVLGYVGTTGNAPKNAPHIHFQVMRYDDPRRYWEGEPLNPHGFFVEPGRKRDE